LKSVIGNNKKVQDEKHTWGFSMEAKTTMDEVIALCSFVNPLTGTNKKSEKR